MAAALYKLVRLAEIIVSVSWGFSFYRCKCMLQIYASSTLLLSSTPKGEQKYLRPLKLVIRSATCNAQHLEGGVARGWHDLWELLRGLPHLVRSADSNSHGLPLRRSPQLTKALNSAG